MKTAQRKTNDERGFTLIEVLMAGALGALLLSALAVSTGLFLDFYKVNSTSRNWRSITI
jgi:prepilin-type N-terminal cleavage/methylation domain-containing protein